MAGQARPPDKLSVLVVSGEFARVHYALVLAAGAASVGTPATVLFTLDACRALVRESGWQSLTGAAADEGYQRGGVAGFEALLAACRELEVRLMVCEMGLRAAGLSPADLRGDLSLEIAGVVTFLADARAGGVLATL